MHAAEGILTTRGGMTSHAAVVARGMGKPCVSGAGALRVDYAARHHDAPAAHARGAATSSPSTARPARCSPAACRWSSPSSSGEFATLMGWADEVRSSGVRANADTPADARAALQVRRRGHRALPHRAHVLRRGPHPRGARDDPRRRREGAPRARSRSCCRCSAATSSSCSRSWTGLPVTIRLLDPPLHEFLPHSEEEIAEVAAAMGADPKQARRPRARAARVQPDARLPRLPARHRLSRDRRDAGARDLRGRGRGRPSAPASRSKPEVMVPLIATKAELDLVKARIDAMAQAVAEETGAKLDYQVGTMIELPRAALLRRRDRAERRVLLLRHQRSHADDLRHQPRRRRELPRHLHRRAAFCRPTRSSRSTAKASASWCASASSAAARRRQDSRSASAASMAATRPRSRSATRSASITSRARRSASRSRASPPPRLRSAKGQGRRKGPLPIEDLLTALHALPRIARRRRA